MRRVSLVLLVVAALPLFTAASCECNSLCDLPGERLEFSGALLETDDGVAVFAGPAGTTRVAVDHNLSFLDIGENYRVRAVASRRTSAPWLSQVNAKCGGPCDDVNITHPDGTTINTSWWTGVKRSYPIAEAIWIVLAVPLLTLGAVTVHRLRRGGDHDPWADLPDDGSWYEYDGFVDDDGDPA